MVQLTKITLKQTARHNIATLIQLLLYPFSADHLIHSSLISGKCCLSKQNSKQSQGEERLVLFTNQPLERGMRWRRWSLRLPNGLHYPRSRRHHRWQLSKFCMVRNILIYKARDKAVSANWICNLFSVGYMQQKRILFYFLFGIFLRP